MNSSNERARRGIDSTRARRVIAMARKELAHIARDPFTIALAIALPIVMVFLFGSAIEFNLKDIPTAYLDQDRSQSSRRLISAFGSSDYFRMFSVDGARSGMQAVESERARALVVIPPKFEQRLLSGRTTEVQLLMDGADNTAVGAIAGYAGHIQLRATRQILERSATEPIQLASRFLFNPELNSKWFVIPGLVVIVMSILSVLLTALTVAREWENGSMELLLSTPVQPIEVIVGKLAPYAVLGFIAVGLVFIVARLGFDVPFRGSPIVFVLGCLLFLMAYLAQGLLISVITRKQTIAMQVAMISGLLPSQLLSGFIFPIESMPTFFQYFTMILPARWFMDICRDSFLQGSEIFELRLPFFALTVIALLFILISVKRFKKDVEP